MVLNDLGKGITTALQKLYSDTTSGGYGGQGNVTEEDIKTAINDICRCLLQNDVNIKVVNQLKSRIQNDIPVDIAPGINIGRLTTQAVYDALVDILDTPPCSFKPSRKKQKVIMAVGLQGTGKTTTCAKIAHYYKSQGYRVGLVAADTFRAGAIDQLYQNAMRIKVQFYCNREACDPVQVCREGVRVLLHESKCDIVIVDTSGRHCQDTELFAEMQEIQNAIKPDMVFLVLNADIGQAAQAQAEAFFKATQFGAIIISKMDGSGKGGGALSAVASTKVPILFLGVGEHMDDLQTFTPETFVKKLMGMGDIPGLFKTLREHVAQREYENNALQIKNNVQGKNKNKNYMCWAELREQYDTMNSMGNLSDVLTMIPGLSNNLPDISGTVTKSKSKIKVYMTILDSMTMQEAWDGTGKILKELHGNDLYADSRWMRIQKGSGRSWKDIEELIGTKKQVQNQMGMLQKVMKKSGAGGNPAAGGKGGKGGGAGLSGMNVNNPTTNITEMLSKLIQR